VLRLTLPGCAGVRQGPRSSANVGNVWDSTLGVYLAACAIRIVPHPRRLRRSAWVSQSLLRHLIQSPFGRLTCTRRRGPRRIPPGFPQRGRGASSCAPATPPPAPEPPSAERTGRSFPDLIDVTKHCDPFGSRCEPSSPTRGRSVNPRTRRRSPRRTAGTCPDGHSPERSARSRQWSPIRAFRPSVERTSWPLPCSRTLPGQRPS
jgi:hypothetical protein